MSTGTITTLPTPLTLRPATILRPVPLLSRDERRCLLEGLAQDACLGTPPAEAIVTTLLAAFASEALTPAEAQARWADVLAEYGRWAAVEAGDPYWRDLEPGLAASDLAAAINDLTDGTTTYGGDRWTRR